MLILMLNSWLIILTRENSLFWCMIPLRVFPARRPFVGIGNHDGRASGEGSLQEKTIESKDL